jgi:hypothetical protein
MGDGKVSNETAASKMTLHHHIPLSNGSLSREHDSHCDCQRLAKSHGIGEKSALERSLADVTQLGGVLQLMLVGLGGHPWKLNHHAILGQGQGRNCLHIGLQSRVS